MRLLPALDLELNCGSWNLGGVRVYTTVPRVEKAEEDGWACWVLLKGQSNMQETGYEPLKKS